MKNRIKTTLKLTLICSLFFFLSCEKDLYEEQIKSTGNEKKFITFNEFKSNSKAFKLYEDISQVTNQVTQNENGLTQARLIYNEILGFYINTDKILYTVKDDLQTYTFEVYRNTDDLNKVENLVLCFKSSGDFESYLTEYKFTEQDKELIKNGLNVPNYFSKISISSLKGTKLVEEGDYSGAIYHGSDGNCYMIDDIINVGEGEIEIIWVQVDCPNVLAVTDGNESGGDGAYTGPSPSPSYIFYNGVQIPIGSGDWYPGGGEPGTGIVNNNPTNSENNPANPLINTSPVLADDLGSEKAYETAKKIRAIITLSNAQFNSLLTDSEAGILILDFLNQDDSQEAKDFVIEMLENPENSIPMKITLDLIRTDNINNIGTEIVDPIHYHHLISYNPELGTAGIMSKYNILVLQEMQVIMSTYPQGHEFTVWEITQIAFQAQSEAWHFILDIGGMTPVVGPIFDITNAVLYSFNLDFTNASISAIAVVPFVGDWTTVSRMTKRVYNIVGTSEKVILKAYKLTDGTIKFSNRKQLRKMLGIVNPLIHAHHVVPYGLAYHPIVQKAAKFCTETKKAWHPNDIANGIGIPADYHLTGHNLYQTKITAFLNNLNQITPNMSLEEAHDALTDYTLLVKNIIAANPNLTLGEISLLLP